jgi:1-acyl-sn-glycerol-3-phosphate acyltransferase
MAVGAYAVLRTLSISLPTVFEAMLGRVDAQRTDDRLRGWGKAIVRRADVDLTVEGVTHIRRDRACIYMSNHQSHFDIPILYSIFPTSLRMVAKAELFKVPIWGRAMRATGFVPVTRSGDRAGAVAAMQQCRAALERGINVWIAPEGTRSPDGRLGKFKKGGFILARDTGADIVPIAIDGSHDILPKNTKTIRRGVRVRVVFGAPIAVAGREPNHLSNEVREFVLAHLTNP